jgi:hypothetical protein
MRVEWCNVLEKAHFPKVFLVVLNTLLLLMCVCCAHKPVVAQLQSLLHGVRKCLCISLKIYDTHDSHRMDGIRIEFSFGFNKSDSIKFCATEVCAHA